jgi:hypothetical protein
VSYNSNFGFLFNNHFHLESTIDFTQGRDTGVLYIILTNNTFIVSFNGISLQNIIYKEDIKAGSGY